MSDTYDWKKTDVDALIRFHRQFKLCPYCEAAFKVAKDEKIPSHKYLRAHCPGSGEEPEK